MLTQIAKFQWISVEIWLRMKLNPCWNCTKSDQWLTCWNNVKFSTITDTMLMFIQHWLDVGFSILRTGPWNKIDVTSFQHWLFGYNWMIVWRLIHHQSSTFTKNQLFWPFFNTESTSFDNWEARTTSWRNFDRSAVIKRMELTAVFLETVKMLRWLHPQSPQVQNSSWALKQYPSISIKGIPWHNNRTPHHQQHHHIFLSSPPSSFHQRAFQLQSPPKPFTPGLVHVTRHADSHL